MSFENIIRQIATDNGITAKEVRRDMEEAMYESMRSQDSTAKAHWNQILSDGEEPTLEKFFEYIMQEIILKS